MWVQTISWRSPFNGDSQRKVQGLLFIKQKENKWAPGQVYIIYLNLVVHGVVPIFLLVSLNLSIYRRLRYLTVNVHQEKLKTIQPNYDNLHSS
jgi:hypothetical protein